jgi:hypothetical protein
VTKAVAGAADGSADGGVIGADGGVIGADTSPPGDGSSPLPDAAGGSCTLPVTQVCSLTETPVTPPTNGAELISMLTGDWALCDATSVFGTHEAGFSFASDGTWYKLYAQGGQLVRGQGFDEQGTWDLWSDDSGAEPQLNLTLAGGGTIIVFPAFATNPRKVRLNNEGVYVADYVFADCADGGAASTVDASPPATPEAGADGGSVSVQLPAADGGSCTLPVTQVCSLSETPVAPPTSGPELISMMTGDWALCDATSIFGTQEAGFSFASDGTWYKLYAQGGQLVRGQGFDEQGTWDLFEFDGGAEPQLNLTVAGGGQIFLYPAFATNPRKVRLDNNGVYVADYVFAACP